MFFNWSLHGIHVRHSIAIPSCGPCNDCSQMTPTFVSFHFFLSVVFIKMTLWVQTTVVAIVPALVISLRKTWLTLMERTCWVMTNCLRLTHMWLTLVIYPVWPPCTTPICHIVSLDSLPCWILHKDYNTIKPILVTTCTKRLFDFRDHYMSVS